MDSQLRPITPKLKALLANKDRKLFDYLYENYASTLYAIIVKVVHSEEDAKEVLQESFVKIWKNIESYDTEKGSIFTWMLNVSRNTAIDFTRSSAYKQQIHSEDIIVSIDKHEEGEADSMGLRELISQMKPEQQMLLDMVYFQGYTHEETAKKLEMPLGTVKTKVRAAILLLRHYFNINSNKE